MLAQKFSYITTGNIVQKRPEVQHQRSKKNKKFRYIELGSSGKKPQAVHRGYMDDVNIDQLHSPLGMIILKPSYTEIKVINLLSDDNKVIICLAKEIEIKSNTQAHRFTTVSIKTNIQAQTFKT